MKNKKSIIFMIIVTAIFGFFIKTDKIFAEDKNKLSFDFTNKVEANVLGININGTKWNDKNDIFYSDNGIYDISIDFAPPVGINPVIIYDTDIWKDKIEETAFCFKGCSYHLNVNNSDNNEVLVVSLTEAYTVTFETNGGSTLDSKLVEINDKLVKPTNPTKDGYVFDGWYIDDLLNESYNFDTPITKDIILYAKWIEKTYNYIFIDGDNQGFNVGNIESYILKIDGNYLLFDSLKIGNLDLIKDEDYTISEGSTIITFTENGITKLNSLSKGEYEVIVKYSNDKEVKGKLIMNSIELPKPDIENPKTGDSIILYLIICILSLICYSSLLKYKRFN